MNNCGLTDKNTRATLLAQYQRSRKARYDGLKKNSSSIARTTYAPISPHLSIFKVSFAKVTVESDLMADQVADPNFISVELLRRIKRNQPDVVEEALRPHQVYRGVTGDPCLTCYFTVKVDAFLLIRHGKSLILRNIT